MTRRDAILKAIADHWAQHGYAPTIRELIEATGTKGPATVLRDLRALRAEGLVTFAERRPRTIRLVEPLKAGQE